MKIKKTLALKARFTSGTPVGSAPIELTRPKAFSGCLHGDLNSWGAAPGLILRQRLWRFERLQISLNRSKMKFHDSTCPPLSANQIALADFLGTVPGLIPVEEFTIGQVTIGEAFPVKLLPELAKCYVGMSLGALLRLRGFHQSCRSGSLWI